MADPFDFAYTLLISRTSNPKCTFSQRLKTGRENTLTLKMPIRVHIVHLTAFVEGKDDIQVRSDIYGRDAKVFAALSKAGVSLRAARG